MSQTATELSAMGLITKKEVDSDKNPIYYSPTSGGVVTLKTGRREVPDSNPGRTC